LYKLIEEKLNQRTKDRYVRQHSEDSFNWRGKQLSTVLRFPIRMLKNYIPPKFSFKDASRLHQIWKTEGLTEAERELLATSKIPSYSLDDALQVVEQFGVPVKKLLAYLAKQKRASFGDYKDYLSECRGLGYDLSLERIKYPKDLLAEHRATSEEYSKRKNAIQNKELKQILKKYKPLEFNNGTFIIKVPDKASDIKNEGAKLHHCVGGYVGRIASGETVVLFVRKADAPEKPFYTLEYKKGAVIQCRTTNNKSYESDKDVKVFVEQWQREIPKLMKGAKV
jgi:hypothetical protein